MEIEAALDISRFIDFELQDDTLVSVSVDVLWLPPKCLHWGVFGHNDKACAHKPVVSTVKVWLPKQTDDKVSSAMNGQMPKDV